MSSACGTYAEILTRLFKCYLERAVDRAPAPAVLTLTNGLEQDLLENESMISDLQNRDN
jgi:hypothetical protein